MIVHSCMGSVRRRLVMTRPCEVRPLQIHHTGPPMYADFYGLRELPFNITPDPRFLYLNNCYQEALAALGYGIDARKGFISLVGEAGTGKTTLLRRLLDTLGPNTR